jgi:HK97 family phage prohead protease
MIKKLNLRKVEKLKESTEENDDLSNGLVLSYVASTEQIDRYGDIVEQKWDLVGFQKNPVVLFNHRQDSLPIARAKDIKVENNQLLIDVEFDMKDEESARIGRKAKDGFLNAVSVGFAPLEYTPRSELPKEHKFYSESGNIFHKSELLEVSIVTVPANSSATEQTARKDFNEFENVLKDWKGKKAKTRFLSNLRKHILRVEETEDRYIVHFLKDEEIEEEIDQETQVEEDDFEWLEEYLEADQKKSTLDGDLDAAPKDLLFNPNEQSDEEINLAILGDSDWERVKKAFVYFDEENAESFDGYKWRIARMWNEEDPANAAPESGQLMVFFDELIKSFSSFNDDESLSEEERAEVYAAFSSYYEKFEEEIPALKEYADAAEEEEEEEEEEKSFHSFYETDLNIEFNNALIRALTENGDNYVS